MGRRVETTIVFDKPSIRTDEKVQFTFKVKNISSERLPGLRANYSLQEPAALSIVSKGQEDGYGWGPLGRDPGVTLEPGASTEVKVTAQVKDIQKDTASLHGFVSVDMGNGVGLSVGEFSSSIRVIAVASRVTGVAFGDKNGNGVVDQGEQLAGVTHTLRYINGPAEYTATSAADGRIDFGSIPAAEYTYGGGDEIKGWLVPWKTVQIRPDGKELLFRSVPPLNGALTASIAFTRDSYKKGELARLVVTLTNSGPIPLTEIEARCNRVDVSFGLKGGPGWGPLSRKAGGVTIAAGQTRTFNVSEPVPDDAFAHGYIGAGCDFGYSEVGFDNRPTANAKAAVPGARASVVGDVVHDPGQGKPRQGLAGVKVVLVSDEKCPVAGEQVTDAKGHFEIPNVAPGPDYRLYFLPPQGWRIKYDNPTSILFIAQGKVGAKVGIEVEPGDAPLPTVPTQVPNCGVTPTPPAPAPGGQPGSGSGQSGNAALASTGADVLGLGAFTLVTLALGAGLLLASRRRRQPD
ncbi:hypothetical protein [Amycolatopsis sp. lyj-112]|uniref:hypothetical protein n=1 Tax=Amycolatopsis sp. lyj-112 TaxID=2789288 RepID=UPI003979B3CE